MDDTTKQKQAQIKAVRDEYVAGQLSVSEIARRHGVSHACIHKWAKKFGWQRNLTRAVRNKIQEDLVTGEFQTPLAVEHEQQIIDAAAKRGVEVINLHRADLARLRVSFKKLISQLEKQLPATDERLLPMLAGQFGTESLEAATKILASLARVQASLQPLERQAFNLDGPTESDDPLSSLLRQIDGQSKGLSGLTDTEE